MDAKKRPRFWVAPLRRVAHLGTYARLTLALGVGGLTWLVAAGQEPPLARLVLAWDAYAATALALLWAAILTADAARIRLVAAARDLSRTVGFLFILLAAGASLLAVVVLLGTMKGLKPAELVGHIGMSIAAVGQAWLLVHTVFTLRYAHAYYDAGPDGRDFGGLEFPGTCPEPDYLDIAYFAFIIGMTAQTADIGISSRTIRRLALIHGLISFVFNTALVAMVVSGVAGVL